MSLLKPAAQPCHGTCERKTPGRRYVDARWDCPRTTTHPSGYCTYHRSFGFGRQTAEPFNVKLYAGSVDWQRKVRLACTPEGHAEVQAMKQTKQEATWRRRRVRAAQRRWRGR